MIISITLPKLRTSIGTWTGTSRWTIFGRANIDGLSRVSHPIRFVAAARGDPPGAPPVPLVLREGGGQSRGLTILRYLGMNVNNPTTALASTSSAGLILYCS